MTIRKVINTRKRIASFSMYGGLLVSAGVIQYYLNQGSEPDIWSFIGFFIGFAIMVIIKVFTKCPKCKGNLGSTLMNSGSFISLSKNIKHCPLCGTSVDEPL